MILSERTTASPSRKRGLRLAALLGAVPLVLSGIIGVATSASADTAPVCPADTADTAWVLEGNVCVGTTTETAPSEETSNTWACPEGYASDTDPVTSESVCSKKVDRIQDYKCPSGYTTTDDPVTKDSDCTKVIEVNAYWKHFSKQWKCLNGYTTTDNPVTEDSTCTKEVKADAERDGKSYCPDSMQTRDRDHDDDGHGGGCTVYADPINTVTYGCPEGYSTSDDPVTSESTCTRQTTEEVAASCPVAGDVLTNIGDEEVANWQCITPATPATPIGGGGAAVFTASAASSGGVELCLVDGVTTTSITYDVTESATGPTPTDAQYAANVAAVDAVNASIAAQTPEGATLGACGAPIAEVPVVVSPVLPATVPEEPESVAVPQAATVPAAVPAGGGSEAPAMPTWALALALIAAIGGTAAASRLVTAGK
ncbi:MAG: hypothetical protein WAO50_00330 [Candidatus Nanopelagicales bacterium]